MKHWRPKTRFNKTRFLVVFMVTVIGATLLARSFAATSSTAVSGQDYFGVAAGSLSALSDQHLDEAMTDLKQLGAHWLRLDYDWSNIGANGLGQYDWGATDRVVDRANQLNIKILAVLTYTPRWALASDGQAIPIDQKGVWSHYPPANNTDFANFAQAAAQHNGAKGVHYYEIWNEANNSSVWRPAPDVGKYTDLLKQSYTAIKAGDSSAAVISSGLSPGGGANDPVSFLSGIYNSNGGSSSGAFDAVGWHPYCQPSAPGSDANCAWGRMSQSSPSARSVMAAHGDLGKKIWMTEYGAPTGGTSDPSRTREIVSEASQASFVTLAYQLVRNSDWAGPLFMYTLKDYQSSQTSVENFFGMVRYDGSQKPSFSAYQQAVNAAKPPDTTPPTNVAVVSPAAGASVHGTINLNATASDDTAVTKLEYYVDNTLIGTAPYSIYGYIYLNWNSATVVDGNHTLSAKAYDAAGYSTNSSGVSITTTNGNHGSGGSGSTPPNTSNGSTVASVPKDTPAHSSVTVGENPEVAIPVAKNVLLSPSVDAGQTLTKVEYYVDGKLVYTAKSGDFKYDLNTGKLKNGHHLVETKSYYQSGQTQSSKQYIDVRNPVPIWLRPLYWSIAATFIIFAVVVFILFKNGNLKPPHWPQLSFSHS